MFRLLSIYSPTTLQFWLIPSSPQVNSLQTGLRKKLNIYNLLNLNAKNDVKWTSPLSTSIMFLKSPR